MLRNGSASRDSANLATPERRRQIRLEIARAQIPEILAWAGVLTLLFGIVNAATLSDEGPVAWAVNLVFGPVFIGLAWAIHAGHVPVRLVPWVWAACSVSLVALLANSYRVAPSESGVAYVAVIMCAFSVLTSAWLPFVVAGALMLALMVPALVTGGEQPLAADVIACVTALLVSAVLLRLRIRALDALAESQEQLAYQATCDVLSGVLNRNGLQRAIPGIVGSAERTGEFVLVWFVDVCGLKAANDRQGHDLGDAIIGAVGRCLSASVRTNDVVGRWGGDEFVVLGTGHAGSAEPLNERVNSALAADADLAGRWSGAVTVGFACGRAEEGVERLISAADEHMYQRRHGG
jgi:diguanylate cyclase (GGDEF)-like protein